MTPATGAPSKSFRSLDEGGEFHRRRGQLNRSGRHAAQVAEAMHRHYNLGITTLLLKGFDPLGDDVDFGKRFLPLVREGAAWRDASSAR
jgi:hypothetical protein